MISENTEAAEKSGMSSEEVRDIMKIAQDPVSFEAFIAEEEYVCLGDLIPDDDSSCSPEDEYYETLRERLLERLKVLTLVQAQVVRFRYGLDDGCPRTLAEVSEKFNISRERIRQIEEKFLRRSCRISRVKRLKDYLD